ALFFIAILVDWLSNYYTNPITSLLILLRKTVSDDDEASTRHISRLDKSQFVQGIPDLVIEGVHKLYSNGFHAVRGVDINLYKGQ
ncbi:hypothetical protein PMAYCL1PPCAC_22765, partial [Pristionchus mayeri]